MKKSNRKLPKIIAGKKLTNDASKDVCAVTKHKIIKLICLAGPFFLPRSREQRLLQFTVVIMIKSYSRKLFKSVQCPFFNMGKKQVEGIFIFLGSAGDPPPSLPPTRENPDLSFLKRQMVINLCNFRQFDVTFTQNVWI